MSTIESTVLLSLHPVSSCHRDHVDGGEENRNRHD